MDRRPKWQFLTSAYAVLYGLVLAGQGGGWAELIALVWSPEAMVGIAIAVLLPILMITYRRLLLRRLRQEPGSEPLAARFFRLEPLSYLVLAAGAALRFAMYLPAGALTVVLCLGVLAVQAGILLWALDEKTRVALAGTEQYIAILFMISGFSALIYQVVWQRILFSTFGINSESVTVIVSVFMFGLGVGSLAGGAIQKRYPQHMLRLFLAMEILIGAYGLASEKLIGLVSMAAGQTSTATLVLWVYLILAVPTLMMGATLPILVSWLQGKVRNIGKSVGLLYAFNTFGSAFAAICTVQLLFVLGGLQSALWTAAACNFLTAALIWDASRKIVRTAPAIQAQAAPVAADGPGMSFVAVFVLLAAIGYISLSQEILWFRLLGFMTANRPQVFGMMLGAFLVGIAYGSLRSKSQCERGRHPSLFLLGAVALAALVFYLSVPAVAWLTGVAGKTAGEMLAYAAVAAVACFTGGVLPLLIHVGVTGHKADSAQAMSWLYFANIAGATLGPLVTGFILLDRYTLEQNMVLLTVLTAALLLFMLMVMPLALRFKGKVVAGLAVMAGLAWTVHGPLYSGHLEKLQYGELDKPAFRYVLENRSGILTVEKGDTDVMYGNGIYDGRFNTDPLLNSNNIDRALMVVNLHPHPRKMLEIGLSTGSWTRVIADHPLVEHLTVVEINKGYTSLVARYPDIATILNDPKIELVVDDGRRWLRNHPDERFDVILMNTSYFWRSNMTNLLSTDFLRLARSHLAPGGVIYYNTTGSVNVVRTAAAVFPHVTMYSNFVAASDSPFDMTREQRRANLVMFPSYAQGGKQAGVLEALTKVRFHELGPLARKPARLPVTTDDNMAVEYKVPN